jgi:hypothetical protein
VMATLFFENVLLNGLEKHRSGGGGQN